MNKVIGIPGYKQQDSNGFGVGNHYLSLASRYGNPRIIMPWEEHVPVDLVILPGGMDINPSSYGEIPQFNTGNQDVFKQFFYDKRLATYVELGTPIFGICLGFQQLASFFGSKIIQHMPYHKQSAGRMTKGHLAYVTNYAADILGVKVDHKMASMDVNSHHHQGVLLDTLSPQLLPLAVAANEEYGDDTLLKNELEQPHNIVEAFMHRELPIAGCQYHPEEWHDWLSDTIIAELLERK